MKNLLKISIILIPLTVWWLWPSPQLGVEVNPSDIAPAGVYQSPEALKAYIKRVVLNGELPNFDTSQISTDEVAQAYKEVAEDYGALNPGQSKKNLFLEIRDRAENNNELVKPIKYK